ncbi:MAG: trypsin-like peptidase domain-containing protein [Chloroflexota bacterium]|nr:trypsin-like peptidase domain-containing protein [Chloroflexota bacterium]
MQGIKQTAKIGAASLLTASMLGLGGLTMMNASTGVGLSSLMPSHNTATQGIVSSKAVALLAPATTVAPLASAPAQSAGGVADARTAVRQAGPAVVTVVNTLQQQTNRRRYSVPGQGQSPAPEALGSGIIIDGQGDIITNQHVVAGQQTLQVIFADGTEVPATLVGGDTYSDIAVIKVSAKVPAVAQFADSDKLEPGQPVVAIGTALGDYSNTVTEGIVSALHRQLPDGGTSSQDMIQTDAAINHGNSGGPLLDINGNVVGINTAVVRSAGMTGDVAEGLGFAIPSNSARTVAAQLMKSGSINRPFIGIGYQVITPQVASGLNLARQQGIYVTSVAAGSPAEKAGIQQGSIVTKLDGVALGNTTANSLTTLLSKHNIGDSVKLTVLAPGATSEKDVTLVLVARPSGQ